MQKLGDLKFTIISPACQFADSDGKTVTRLISIIS